MAATSEPRIKKRVPCLLALGSSRLHGMVLNVSRRGLFVQSSAAVDPGQEVWLELRPAGSARAIPVAGRVVWRRVIAPQLRSVTTGGFGMQLHSATEDYYALLSGKNACAAETVAAAPPRARDTRLAEPTFRVRLQSEGGPRSRTLLLTSPSVAEARRRALLQCGRGWTVLEVAREG